VTNKFRRPPEVGQFDREKEIDLEELQFMEELHLMEDERMLRRRMVWHNAVQALGELAAHCVAAVMMIAALEIIQWITDRLSGTNDGFVFFRQSEFAFSIKWLFDAADIGIMTTFSFVGCLVFFRAYNRAP